MSVKRLVFLFPKNSGGKLEGSWSDPEQLPKTFRTSLEGFSKDSRTTLEGVSNNSRRSFEDLSKEKIKRRSPGGGGRTFFHNYYLLKFLTKIKHKK